MSILLFPFKVIIFIIKLPFIIIGKIIESIGKIFSYIYNKFMQLFKFSLAFKITFLYFLLGFTTLVILCSSFLFGLREYFIYMTNETLDSDLATIEQYLRTNNTIGEQELNTYLSRKNTIEIYQKKDNIFNSSSILKINQTIGVNWRLQLNYINEISREFVIGNKNYKVYLTSDFKDYLFILEVVAITLIIISGFMLLGTIILSSNIGRKMFNPIKRMTVSTKRITGENLNKRINVSNSYDELRDLGNTFNEMMDRIQSSYDQQKQFVNDASHELRTPIAVIQGYINMLDRWGKDDQEILEESISAIKNESENMERLVSSLLFLARADKGTQNLEKENFHLETLIDELVKETQMIDTKHRIINNNEANLIINADRNLLKQGLRIFIQNSIKYTPEKGSISLESYSEENCICIVIKDTGIGIPKKDIPHIFDRFYRADESRTKNTGGTGLGLAIAKWIIYSHGGDIDVRSAVNVGTKITVKLPYKENSNVTCQKEQA